MQGQIRFYRILGSLNHSLWRPSIINFEAELINLYPFTSSYPQEEDFNRKVKEQKQSDFISDYIQTIIDTADTKVLPNGKIGLSLNRIKGTKSLKDWFSVMKSI